MATPFLLFLLVIQSIIRNRKRTWSFRWKPLITINSKSKSVVTWKWLPYYLDYKKDLQNIAASFVNGTAELDLFITQVFFLESCGAVSDEHGEHLHQDISAMEKRYQGKWKCAVLANYCWTFARHVRPCHGIRAKGTSKKIYVILFVLNNELT